MNWNSLSWIEFKRLKWINVEKMQSRSRHFLPGARALRTLYLEPEPESEPECFPGAGAGGRNRQKFSRLCIPDCSNTNHTMLTDMCRSSKDLRRSLLSVSVSRGPVFRRYLLNVQIDHDENLAQGASACDLIFHNILL